MNRITFLLLVFLTCFSQRGNNNPLDVTYETFYHHETELFDVKFSLRVSKDKLLFERNDEVYNSNFLLKVNVLQNDQIVWTNTREHSISENTSDFSPREVFQDTFRVELKAQSYVVEAFILDHSNNFRFKKNTLLSLDKSSTKTIEIDNISVFEHHNGVFKYVPLNALNQNVDVFKVNFSLFTLSYLDRELRINVKVLTPKREELFKKELKGKYFSTQKRLSEFSVLLQRKVFKSDVNYILLVELIDDSGNVLNRGEKALSFLRNDFPSTTQEMNNALKYMEYVANSDSIEYYTDKPVEKSLDYYKRVWKQLARSKVYSEYVKVMREYFERVRYANRAFSGVGRHGWRSDRGRIFIKFGNPDEVTNHPFNVNQKPYVVWSYYNLRKQFVFIDHTGFGDYRLTVDSQRAEYY